MVFLRIVHTGFGVFWVGTGIFIAFILLPRLRSDRAKTQAAVWRVITRFEVIFPISTLMVVATGVAIAIKVKWGVLDTFFASGWGYAILIGFRHWRSVALGLPTERASWRAPWLVATRRRKKSHRWSRYTIR